MIPEKRQHNEENFRSISVRHVLKLRLFRNPRVILKGITPLRAKKRRRAPISTSQVWKTLIFPRLLRSMPDMWPALSGDTWDTRTEPRGCHGRRPVSQTTATQSNSETVLLLIRRNWSQRSHSWTEKTQQWCKMSPKPIILRNLTLVRWLKIAIIAWLWNRQEWWAKK